MLQRNKKGKNEIKNSLNYRENLKEIHLKAGNFPNKLLTGNEKSWEFCHHFWEISGTLPKVLSFRFAFSSSFPSLSG